MEEDSDLKKGMGKYFGVCPSYHHSKGCKCSNCPSYPGDDRYMYCARGVAENPAEDKGCLCEDCYVYHQFALEGNQFCRRTPE